MTGLLRAEIRRLLSRRLVRVFFSLCVLGIVIAAISVFFRSHQLSPADAAAAEQRRIAEVEACAQGDFGISDSQVPEGMSLREYCEEIVAAPVNDPRFHLVWLEEGLLALAVPLMILAWVIGATFIGAEWQTGSIATLLTWESRRPRVFVAKLLAAAVSVAVAGAFLLLLLGALLWPAAEFRGVTAGVDADWLRSTAGGVARASGLAVVAAIIGLSISSVARTTGAALGVGFFYIAVVESVVRGFRPQWAPWLFSENAGVFLTANELGSGRTTGEAAALLAAYAAGLGAVALIAFMRRDIT